MEFITTTTRTDVDIPVTTYFDGKCVSCGSACTKIRSSYHRNVPNLGTPFERVIARVQMATVECNDCGHTFTPVPGAYPPKYEYSLAIVTYALARYYYDNTSANVIARDLKLLHNVDVPEDTIYSWIKRLSEDYVQSITRASGRDNTGIVQGGGIAKVATLQAPAGGQGPKAGDVKTITIDGTFVTTGVDVVGKKKRAGCLSVTKLENGTLRLTSYP